MIEFSIVQTDQSGAQIEIYEGDQDLVRSGEFFLRHKQLQEFKREIGKTKLGFKPLPSSCVHAMVNCVLRFA